MADVLPPSCPAAETAAADDEQQLPVVVKDLHGVEPRVRHIEVAVWIDREPLCQGEVA